MARAAINRGTTAGDGTGETAFSAFTKVNDNFIELYDLSHPGYTAGAWYWEGTDGGVSAGGNPSANTIYAMPTRIHKPVTLQSLGVTVSTPVASSTGILGIYSNVAGRPAAKLLETAAISTATAADVSVGASITLQVGWYWLASILSHAPQMNTASNQNHVLNQWIGNAGPAPQYNTPLGLSVAQTYGSLPGTMPAMDYAFSGNPVPFISFRVA